MGTEKDTSGSCSSPKRRNGLKFGKGILYPRQYTDLSTDLGSEARTLFRLGTGVRYLYVPVRAKLHTFSTSSRHRRQLARWFFR